MHVLLLAAALRLHLADDAVRLIMRTERVAGLSVVMAHDGHVVYEAAAGYADLGRRVPATPQTVYRIGSLTKPFTAAAVLLLARQGKLALDDPIARYVHVPWPGPITIAELLEQRSGLPSYSDVASLSRYGEYEPEQLLDAAAAEPLVSSPGAQYAYSNTNYLLLGMLIESAAQEPFGRFLATQIVQPLQLRHTRYGDRDGQAHGYARDTLRTPVRPTSVSYAYAAAGMTSNAPDLVRFLESAKPPYDGFAHTTMYGYDVEYASGFVAGYSAFELLDAQTRDAIAILTNADALDLSPLALDLFASLEPPKPGTAPPE